jgi:alpha-beta hydrolase superfamily lysophospholipase
MSNRRGVIAFATVLGVFPAAAWAGAGAACDPIREIHFSEAPRFETESLAFPSGDVRLGGCLYRPPGAGRFPVIVLAAGSDDAPAAASVYSVIHAKAFTSRGVGVFSFDKRGVGSSGGSPTGVDFAQRAEDVAAAARFVRGLPSTSAVALWGVSQAGWVVPGALRKDDGVRFAILVSPAGVDPNDQVAFYVRQAALRSGMTPKEAAAAESVHRAVVRYYATGRGYEEAQRIVDRHRNAPWFEKFRTSPDWDEKIGAGGRLLAPAPLKEAWKTRADDFAFYRAPSTFQDYRSLYAKLDRPVLIVQGSADTLVPVADANALFREVFRRNGNRRAEFKIFEGAEHGIQDGPRVRPAYLDFTSQWAAEHFAGASR